MYFIDPNSLVQAAHAGQLRTPKAKRQHSWVLRSHRTTTSSVPVATPHRHARLRTLVVFHHAYS
jgi:hypothetical protein